MSLNEYIYLLSQESGTAPSLPPVDYIIVAGQSNMDGRTDKAAFDSKYSGPMANVLVWNGASLQQWKPDLTGITLSNKVNQLAWDTLVLKDLADQMGVTLRVIKHTWGGTAVGMTQNADYILENGSWNIGVPGANWQYLRDKIRSVIRYEREVNQKQARFRMLLWDQGESDGDVLAWSQNYVTYSNSTLAGNFINLISAMRTEAQNAVMPVVFAQKMSTQTGDPYRSNIIAAQALFDTYDANAYMLAMDSNTARYPLQDQYHYNATAVANIGTDMKAIVTSNNLLAGWV